MIIIELPGEPRGKGRPRSAMMGGGGRSFIRVYTDAKTRKYEKALAWSAKAAMKGNLPLEGPLVVTVRAAFSVPKSWSRKDRDAALTGVIRPTGRPDLDNLMKVIDALNEIVWTDDSQVTDARVVKFYSETPSLRIEVKSAAPILFAPPDERE